MPLNQPQRVAWLMPRIFVVSGLLLISILLTPLPAPAQDPLELTLFQAVDQVRRHNLIVVAENYMVAGAMAGILQ